MFPAIEPYAHGRLDADGQSLYWEECGNPAGTPAVVTDSGGMPEYVTPGRNGEVVPPGRPDELADALERVLARAREMGDAAREDVARFAPEQAARETAALLQEAAGK